MPSTKMTEEEWWDRYGDLQERIWRYDEYLEEAVRGEYLQDMVDFLFEPGGRVLDYGCGSGWVGLRLAERGMRLDGIDVSGEQIKRAEQFALEQGITSARFWQGGIQSTKGLAPYDSVIVHSLFHHLNKEEKQTLLHSLTDILVDQGRAYFYEPVADAPGESIVGRVLDKSILGILWLLRKSVYWLRLQEPDIREGIRRGWTLQSPEEAPVDLEAFMATLPSALTVTEITYWHMCAVAHASVCMGLRQPWRRLLSRLTPIPKRVDDILLQSRWRTYLQAWPMVGIKVLRA